MHRVKYTGTEPIGMTYYGITWQPDEIKDVDDEVYAALRNRADFEDVKDEDKAPRQAPKAKEPESVSGGDVVKDEAKANG